MLTDGYKSFVNFLFAASFILLIIILSPDTGTSTLKPLSLIIMDEINENHYNDQNPDNDYGHG